MVATIVNWLLLAVIIPPMARLAQFRVPLILLAISIVSYGLLAHALGYYWDGWPMAWIAETYGNSGLTSFFATNRPVWGWLFQLTTPLIGHNPLAWQIFGIFARWLAAIALWGTLRRLWPGIGSPLVWVAILFIVYPGFSQSSIAILYGHNFLVLALTLFSIALHLRAIQGHPRPALLTGLSLAIAAYAVFANEYFFGLELLRPLLLFMAFPPSKTRARLIRVAKFWWPFAALLAIYSYWRIFILGFHLYDPAAVFTSAPPAATLTNFLANALQDVLTSGFSAWGLPVQKLIAADWASRLTWLQSFLIPFSGLGLFFAVRSNLPPDRQFARTAILLGLAALLLGGLPVWAAGQPIRFEFPLDRLTLPFIIGSALLLVGLAELLIQPALIRTSLLATVAALAISSQFANAAEYRQDWKYQNSFFWQLAWRAPAIQPGTIVLLHELDNLHLTDNSLVGPLNWLYAPGLAANELTYYAAYLPLRSQPGSFLENLRPAQSFTNDFLVAPFHGSTNQVLVLLYQPPGCLRILDPVYDLGYPQLPQDLAHALELANPAQLVLPAETPTAQAASLFGPSPSTQSWCFYFQQADLARQVGDWEAVAALGDIAFGLTDSPNHATERLPFIEAYAMTHREDLARQLTEETLQINPQTSPMLCRLWQRVASANPATDSEALQEMLALTCK